MEDSIRIDLRLRGGFSVFFAEIALITLGIAIKAFWDHQISVSLFEFAITALASWASIGSWNGWPGWD